MLLTDLQKQRHLAPTTICTGGRFLHSLNRHRRRAKTRRFGAATLADGESSNVIVLIPVVLARREAKVIRVPGRKAKDQSKLFRRSLAFVGFS